MCPVPRQQSGPCNNSYIVNEQTWAWSSNPDSST